MWRPKTGYCLVAICKGCPLEVSVRGWLGVRLTIRSPKVCTGPYIAIGYCTNFGSNLHQEGRHVTPQKRVLACRPVLHHCVVIFFWSSGIIDCMFVYIWKWSSAHALGGRQWCGTFHYHWWTASIKPRLLFSHSGLVSWWLPFLQFDTIIHTLYIRLCLLVQTKCE